MAKTIVGMFDSPADAHSAVRELVDMGVSRSDISLVAGDTKGEYTTKTGNLSDEMSGAAAGAGTGAILGGIGGLLVGLGALAIPGVGPLIAAGPIATTLLGAGVGAAAGGLLGALVDVGVPEDEANYYAEGVRRGGVLVSVRAEDEMVDRVVSILERYNAVDVQRRAEEWRREGWTRFDPTAQPYTHATLTAKAPSSQAASATTGTAATTTAQSSVGGSQSKPAGERERAIPVIEEELQIGKRAVSRGGVRVFSRVVETPVEEHVQLRDEHVTVERRPVNRNATAGDTAAFKEDVIEVRETDEEAVVAKQARVVEEVVVRKDVEQRTETVRDTVRRTEVGVENLGAAQGQKVAGFETYANDFRSDFTSKYGNRGYTYDRYEPAYRYGYTLASDTRYAGKIGLRSNPTSGATGRPTTAGRLGKDFKDSIRYGWDQGKRSLYGVLSFGEETSKMRRPVP